MATRNSVVAALMVIAVVLGITSAQGPSMAPAYAPAKSTFTAAPTTSSPAPDQSTISAAPTTIAAGPSISEAPESSTFPDIASPPAPGSEAAEGPAGDFSAPAPVADGPAKPPTSTGTALKVSAVVGAAAVISSLLF